MTTQTQTRTNRRAHTKNRSARRAKVAAYYSKFRGGKSRHNV